MWEPDRVSSGTTRLAARALGAATLVGAGVTAYAAREARQYTLRRVEVPLLPAGMRPLRVLHLSDLHLTPGQIRKQQWVRGLAALVPDLVIDTGDNLAHPEAVPVVLDCLGPLLDRPGVFVHGSNDYFAPGLRNPLGYLLPDNGKRHTDTPALPWPELSSGFTAAGWLDLTNRRDRLEVGETGPAFAGVDDPTWPTTTWRQWPVPPRATRTCGWGCACAVPAGAGRSTPPTGTTRTSPATPTADRCACPAAARSPRTPRPRAGAGPRPAPHPADSRPDDPGSAWLHVSAGLGTNPYAACGSPAGRGHAADAAPPLRIPLRIPLLRHGDSGSG